MPLETKRSLNREIWLRALNSNDLNVRRSAVRKLARLKNRGDHEIVVALCKTLSDENWKLRADAASALSKLKSPDAVGSLIKALADKTGTVQKKAAEALGEIGDASACDALCKMICHSKQSVRNYSVFALFKIGAPSIGALGRELDRATPTQKVFLVTIIVQLCNFENNSAESVALELFSQPNLTPRQRKMGLDAIRESLKHWIHFIFPPKDVTQICLEFSKGDYSDTVKLNANSLIDYLTLGRGSEPSHQQEAANLLRPAAFSPETQPETLLRASNNPESYTPTPSLLDKFLQKIREK